LDEVLTPHLKGVNHQICHFSTLGPKDLNCVVIVDEADAYIEKNAVHFDSNGELTGVWGLVNAKKVLMTTATITEFLTDIFRYLPDTREETYQMDFHSKATLSTKTAKQMQLDSKIFKTEEQMLQAIQPAVAAKVKYGPVIIFAAKHAQALIENQLQSFAEKPGVFGIFDQDDAHNHRSMGILRDSGIFVIDP